MTFAPANVRLAGDVRSVDGPTPLSILLPDSAVDRLPGAFASAVAEPLRVDIAVRISPQVLVLQLPHAERVRLQGIVAGVENCLVPRRVQVAQLAQQVVVGELIGGDTAVGGGHTDSVPHDDPAMQPAERGCLLARPALAKPVWPARELG